MTHTEFKSQVEALLLQAGATVRDKNDDYSSGSPNPFAAFDAEAWDAGLTREQVWHVFFMKHIRAVTTWCRTGDLSSEDIKSRLIDIAAYAAILYASIVEGEKNAEVPESDSL